MKSYSMWQTITINKTSEVCKKAEEIYGIDIPVPLVYFSNKMVGCGGLCNYTQKKIGYNTKMLEANGKTFVDEVVPHEVAHWVCKFLYPKSYYNINHSGIWKQVCQTLGGIPKAYHSFEVKKNGTRYIYKCGCKNHEFTKKRHNKAQGWSTYSCKQCKQTLKFSGDIIIRQNGQETFKKVAVPGKTQGESLQDIFDITHTIKQAVADMSPLENLTNKQLLVKIRKQFPSMTWADCQIEKKNGKYEARIAGENITTEFPLSKKIGEIKREKFMEFATYQKVI